MKYIIEIENTPFYNGKEALWRAKGFKSLVFDSNGLDKLTLYQGEPVKRDNALTPGDEIEWRDRSRSVVLDVGNEDFWELDENGIVSHQVICETDVGYHKTGRHYDEVAKVIKKLGEGDR